MITDAEYIAIADLALLRTMQDIVRRMHPWSNPSELVDVLDDMVRALQPKIPSVEEASHD